MPVLIIAGPNLTIDRTATIDELRPGEVLRFSSVTVTAGGKGVNVARVAHALGRTARVVALAPGHTGAAGVALLRDEGLDVVPVAAPGEVRVAEIVLEPTGRVTVLNEPGPMLPPEAWDRYERMVDEALEGASALVCSGSLPPGAPADAYAKLVRLAQQRGLPALVDAAGTALVTALDAEPAVVTPNLAEAEGALGRAAPDGVQPSHEDARRRAIRAAVELAGRGPQVAVVTAGEAGVAVAGTAGHATWYDAPRVEAVRNPVGAGDSFLAGLALSLADGEPLERAIRAALAAAAASVETMLAGGVEPSRVERLLTTLSGT